MSDRRRMIALARKAARLSAEDRMWLIVFLMSGQLPPADELQFERNVRVRRYRQKWYDDLSERAAAKAIAEDAAKFRAGTWRHLQHRASMPEECRVSKTGDLFAIFKLGGIGSAAMVKAVLRG